MSELKKIESFQINHLKLFPGLYVSRRDSKNNCVITTFDLRLTKPNDEPPVDMPALHTIEHLGATFLRNSSRKDDIVYFGPMGCRTGCYLLVFGTLQSEDILPLVIDMCDFILSFEGSVPGASAIECGNYLEQNLTLAKYYIRRYRDSLIHDPQLVYPD